MTVRLRDERLRGIVDALDPGATLRPEPPLRIREDEALAMATELLELRAFRDAVLDWHAHKDDEGTLVNLMVYECVENEMYKAIAAERARARKETP